MDTTKFSEFMHWAKTYRRLPFNLAVSGVPSYPFRDLGAQIEDLELTADAPYGYPPLIEALAEKCGVPVECVVTAEGTSMANHLAIASLTDPGDEIVIEHPTYEPILAVARYLRLQIKRFQRHFEDGFQIIPEEIQRVASGKTRLIVVTNFNNPSGVATSPETLQKLSEIAANSGAHLLVDEVYVETLFPPPGTRYSAFHLAENIVCTASLTKAYGLSGLRCGWILAQPDVAKKMWLLNDLFASVAAHPAERLSLLALRKLAQIGDRARALLERNCTVIDDFFRAHPDLEVVNPGIGTIRFPRIRNADDFCRLLAEQYEVVVVPGRFFEMPDHFRIGIAVDTNILIEGLNRIALALKRR